MVSNCNKAINKAISLKKLLHIYDFVIPQGFFLQIFKISCQSKSDVGKAVSKGLQGPCTKHQATSKQLSIPFNK